MTVSDILGLVESKVGNVVFNIFFNFYYVNNPCAKALINSTND